MNRQEFKRFLQENKRQVNKAVEEFEYHSREFDRKIHKILAAL